MAITIHKSQGSQAGEITVLLPPEDSRLSTRDLFCTAVTAPREDSLGRFGSFREGGRRTPRCPGVGTG
jgi:exodeoxyribonuclease V alpha subunit